MSNEKIGLVKEYPFEEFCLKHFKPRTSWGVKVPITESLTFSSTLITQPLMRLDQDLKKTARQTFKSNRKHRHRFVHEGQKHEQKLTASHL